MSRRLAITLLLIAAVVCCLSAAALAQAQPWTDKDLPSWNEPMRGQLLEYVYAVSTPGHKDFIPPADRIAVFDVDGTLMTERPLLFVLEVALARMAAACPQIKSRSERMKILCRAAAGHDTRYLYQHIGETLSLPLFGMTHAEYRALARQVFETAVNPANQRPQRELVYRPQIELIDLMHRKGFRVYLNSGSDVFALMAISQKYFHVPPERCIGTTFETRVEVKDGVMRFYRTGLSGGDLNLRENKVRNLVDRIGQPPVLAFGNSSGDVWMLRFADSSPHRHLSLVLDHDDPREFVYRKANLLDTAKQAGWTIVSMKDAFKVVY